MRVIVGYRPPSFDAASDAIQNTNHVIACLQSLCNVDASIVLVGDFNFPNIDWSNLQFAVDNDRCSTSSTMFAKQYCVDQLVSEHAQLQPRGNDSLLDLVLYNDPFIVCDVAVCDPFSVSDHCSIKFKVITPVQSASQPAHEFRDFNNADWSSITSYLNSCDWSTIFYDCATASECANAFYVELNAAVSLFVPLKIFRSAKTNKKLSYPQHIRKLYRAKSAAWKRYKRFKTLELHEEYKRLSSRCRKAVYAHTAKLEERIINRDNLGRFFRYANSKFTHKSSVGPLQDGSGNKTIDPQVKAHLLSEYFQSQFTTDNLKLPSTIPCTTDPGISSIIFSPILVKRIINKLNARSAGGPDGIPPVFFKNACSSVCHPHAFWIIDGN